MANFDYNSQAGRIARQRQVLEAMLAQSMQPMQAPNPGPMASQLPASASAAKIFQAMMASKGGQELDQQEEALNLQRADETRQGINRFFQTSQGRPIQAVGNMPAGRSQPDRQRAIFEALAANDPLLQGLAMKYIDSDLESGSATNLAILNSQLQDQLGAKDLSSMATPSSVLANPRDPSTWIPKVNVQPATPGEVMLDEGGNIFQPGSGQGPRRPQGAFPLPPGGSRAADTNGLPSGDGWTTQLINGDLYMRTATGLKKMDNAANVSTTVNNAAPYEPGRKFNEAIELAEAGRFSEALATRDQMLNATKALTEARQLVDTELFNGIAGNLAMNAKRIDAALFGGDDSKVARTEQFKADMGTVILPAMKQLGGNDSNEELKRMEDWMAGNITMTPDAIRASLDRFIEDLSRQAQEIDAIANEIRGGTQLPTLNLPRYGGNNPGAPANAGRVETLAEYLQRTQGAAQ